MTRPTTRVLAVLELLQTHGRMRGSELAQRLQVDGRTLRRYIRALEDLGIPVTAERGRHGGYLLVAGFKLPPLMFTDEETLAVSLGLLAARGLGLADAAPAVASAQAKLERVMPANLKQRVRALSEAVTLDVATATSAGNNAVLMALASAAQARRRVRFSYRSSQDVESERDFDPYGLLFRTGQWYTSGHCHLRGALRSFRLDRIRTVQIVDRQFERPPEFDAAEHLRHSIATIPRSIAVEVLLHAPLEKAVDELGGSIGLFLPHEKGVALHAQTDVLPWFARQLAKLPFGFEVVRPVALRDAVRKRAEQLLALAG